MSNNAVPDSDLAIGGGGGGGWASPPKIFSALRASKNMGGPGLPGPSPRSAYYQ